jgi:hypothetical protein
MAESAARADLVVLYLPILVYNLNVEVQAKEHVLEAHSAS